MKHTVALLGAIAVSVLVMSVELYVTWWVLNHDIEPGMHDIVIYVAGNINAMALAVVTYWVGSSSGSMVKTQTGQNETEVRMGPT